MNATVKTMEAAKSWLLVGIPPEIGGTELKLSEEAVADVLLMSDGATGLTMMEIELRWRNEASSGACI